MRGQLQVCDENVERRRNDGRLARHGRPGGGTP